MSLSEETLIFPESSLVSKSASAGLSTGETWSCVSSLLKGIRECRNSLSFWTRKHDSISEKCKKNQSLRWLCCVFCLILLWCITSLCVLLFWRCGERIETEACLVLFRVAYCMLQIWLWSWKIVLQELK